MARSLNIFTRVFLVLCVSLAASIAIDFLVLDGPRIVERVFSPSLRHLCTALREGVNKEEVFKAVDGHFPAQFQTLRENSIEINGNEGGTCKIEMDFATKKIVKATWEPGGPARFDLSGADAYPEP